MKGKPTDPRAQEGAASLTLPDLQQGAVISVEDWAQLMKVSRGLAYRLARQGRIPGLVRLGRCYRISAAETLKSLHFSVGGPSSGPARSEQSGEVDQSEGLLIE